MRHLRGNVRLETAEMVLWADEVDYDADTGDASARGHVRFEHFLNGDKIECDHADYNTEQETGKFYDVKGTTPAKIEARPGLLTTSNPFYFQGKWAERIRERYILHDGFITDCRLPRPWWTLRGPRFDVVPEERALAYHATFRIRSIPIFYAPVYYKSLQKLPRKSGFLTPNIGNSSRRGKMIGIGYYWAINRSYDLLYRNQYFTERGFAHDLDFRGKVREGTDFNALLYAVNDRGLKTGNTVRKEGGALFSFDGRSVLGNGFYARGEYNYLSSFRFRQAFTESFHEAIFSELHSVGFITKHWNTFGVNFTAQQNTNFLSAEDKDKISIRKLPEVEFVSREHEFNTRVLPLWFSLDSTAGLLRRSEPLYQTRAFVARADFYPRVTTAFRWKGITLTPNFAIRETAWDSTFQNGRPAGRDFLRSAREIGADLTFPSLSRIYDGPQIFGKKRFGEKLKHVIEPRASYRFVDGIRDFNTMVRFDETELMSNTTEVELAVTNRLYSKDKDGSVRELLTWEVMQRRYFDPTFGGAIIPGQRNVLLSGVDLTGYSFFDRPRNYSPVVSALRAQGRVSLEWRADYDPLYGHIVNSGFSADTRISKYLISVGHTLVRTDPLLTAPSNQIRALFGIGDQNRKGWNAAFSAYYDYRRAVMQFATTQVTYNTDCCGISLQFRRFNFGARNENQFRVAFAVSNIGTFGTLKRQERIF